MPKYILSLYNEELVVARERLIVAKNLEQAQRRSKSILKGYKGTCYFGAETLASYGLTQFYANKKRRRGKK